MRISHGRQWQTSNKNVKFTLENNEFKRNETNEFKIAMISLNSQLSSRLQLGAKSSVLIVLWLIFRNTIYPICIVLVRDQFPINAFCKAQRVFHNTSWFAWQFISALKTRRWERQTEPFAYRDVPPRISRDNDVSHCV